MGTNNNLGRAVGQSFGQSNQTGQMQGIQRGDGPQQQSMKPKQNAFQTFQKSMGSRMGPQMGQMNSQIGGLDQQIGPSMQGLSKMYPTPPPVPQPIPGTQNDTSGMQGGRTPPWMQTLTGGSGGIQTQGGPMSDPRWSNGTWGTR